MTDRISLLRWCGRLADGDRLAYPPGHPVTWGAISLETYPHPVFDTSERIIARLLGAD